MTTTVMRDSVVGDAWIQEMCKINPVKRVIGSDGQPNGNLSTGPVRLQFTDTLFTAKSMRDPSGKEDPSKPKKFNCTVLFTPYTDLRIFWEEYYKIAAGSFASYFQNGQYYGIENPIYDQGTKAKHPGFTPGLMATNMSSNYKPQVVDLQMNPIVDEGRVYGGVWAIVVCNAYASGMKQIKKGPRFGLQSVCIIGNDSVLKSANVPDAKEQFQGINVRPPVGVPAAAFGQAPPPGAPPAGGPPNTAQFYPPSTQQYGAAPPPPPPPGSGGDEYDLSQFM